jgi:hypothetical protein
MLHHSTSALLGTAVLLCITASTTAATISFQEGDANGYAGASDNHITFDNPNTTTTNEADAQNGDAGSLFVQNSTVGPNTNNPEPFVFDKHGLIHFADIFGAGPNQIPLGSTIHSATLTVTSNNGTTEGSQYPIHRLLLPFSELTDTWNTWGSGAGGRNTSGGVQTPDEAVAAADDTLVGGTGANQIPSNNVATPVTWDVTPTVSAWAAGAENNGLVILPLLGAGNWGFRSSDFATDPSLRPTLTVDFTPIPEPSMLGFAGGAAALSLLRRRRANCC